MNEISGFGIGVALTARLRSIYGEPGTRTNKRAASVYVHLQRPGMAKDRLGIDQDVVLEV